MGIQAWTYLIVGLTFALYIALFPQLVDDFCRESLLGKAREANLLDLRCHDIRDRISQRRGVTVIVSCHHLV